MRIEHLLCVVFELDPADAPITESTGREDVDGWDSLQHLSVVAALEETYMVTFTTSEMADLVSVPAIRRILKSRAVDA